VTPLRRERSIVWALILGHLLLALAYSLVNPLGEAPDEADHWAYVVHIAREGELPGAKVTQAKHPPFYHATAAAITLAADPTNDFLRINPDAELAPREGWSPNFFIHTAREEWPWTDGVLGFHLARLWSVLLSTVAVAAVYGLARAALPGRTYVALAATALAAFLPEFAFIGSSVSNDGAAALFGTLGLWGGFAIYRNGGRFRRGWWTPLALGLGFLTKVSTAALWPVIGLAIVLGAAGSIRHVFVTWRRWVATGLLVFVPALLIAAPWLLRNVQLYGDLLGTEMVRKTVDLRTAPWRWDDTDWLLRGWFLSFWGRFGGVGHIPLPDGLYWVTVVVSVASIGGVIRLYLRRDWRSERWSLTLLLLAVVAVALGIWQYSLTALGTDQGRLLFPALGAIVILLAAGLLAWLPERSQGAGATVVGVASLVAGLFALAGVLAPAFAPPAPAATSEWRQVATADPVSFGELALIGYTLEPHPVLFWRAAATPVQDWRAVLRVTSEDGSLVWEWRRSPAAGRWSTDRWPKDTVVRDAYTIQWPDWAGSGRYRVEVGMEPYGQEMAIPQQRGKAIAGSDHPYFLIGWLER
jgi:4-amino-4-deoxy-L-arabinose transferase-like glycosyltransferase